MILMESTPNSDEFDNLAKIFFVSETILSIITFIIGFTAASIILLIKIMQLRKELKSTQGFLESERLVKETLRKENTMAFQMKESLENDLGSKLKEAQTLLKIMDEDILLLQKSNEETEAMFKLTQPEMHQLKVKLIEANNTISRMKAQLQQQSS